MIVMTRFLEICPKKDRSAIQGEQFVQKDYNVRQTGLENSMNQEQKLAPKEHASKEEVRIKNLWNFFTREGIELTLYYLILLSNAFPFHISSDRVHIPRK